ncbi:MAG: hypothetical protein VB048_03360, partial [Bacteroidaceae bacterium]|nr:hypothetical protein [Bacteroidaceae bacterium]
MWWIILVIFVAITVVIVVCVLYKRHTKKLLNDAINKSPRLAIIKGINQRYFFKTFKDKFEYVVHFTDLDEFKTSDIKLIKYSFLVKNRSKIRESLLALNNNIELFKKYTAEINNAKLLDDSSFLTNAKVNQDTYHEMEANHISSLVLKPMLKCSFLIYYDYSSPTGRSTRESEHFELRVSEIVDIDSFLINTFPEVNIIDYHFKPHYLNPHLYVHNNLLVTEEAENYLKEVDKKESETKQECLDFYSGKDVYYNWVLPSAVEKYKKTKPELLHYLDNLGLHYRLVESNKYEFFIVIENSVYLYVGHLSNNVPISIAKSQITDAYTVVIELNYNPFFDYKTSTTNEANFIYYKYLTFSEYSPLETGLKRFEALLPDINIRKIN